MFRGKNYKESAKLIDKQALYDPQEALQLVINASKAKFDETVELHVKLGVDGRHADQQVRGAIVLPNGTGKTVRVLVFCPPEQVEEALAPPSRLRKPSLPALTMPAVWSTWRRSRRKPGSSLTPSLPIPR